MTLEKHRILIGWGKRFWINDPTKIKDPVFYFPDFFLKSETAFYLHEHSTEIDLSNLLMQLSLQADFLPPPTPLHWSCPYQDIFRRALRVIHKRRGLARDE